MSPEDIKTYRVMHLNMTFKVFAELLGVTPQAVKLWEQGKRDMPETTVRLIKLFQKFPQLIKEF